VLRRRILIGTAVFVAVLIATIYAFLSFYDFNKFKPMIAQAVKDATGRELRIAGRIEIKWGITPTLIAENLSFQNAPWGSRSNLAKIKRLEIQIAVLPLIRGDFKFIRLVLFEPDVIVESNRAGTSNFNFDTPGGKEEEKTLPALIFSDVRIEKGLFTYKDGESGQIISIKLDRLDAAIPGLDKSVRLDLEGAYDDIPFTLEGTVGPIAAWIEPGHPLPAELTAGMGGATVNVKGVVRDPINFKNLAFTISGEGPFVLNIAKLVGVTDVPELGAFKLAVKVADPEGKLALEGLNIRIGTEELAEISLNGAVKDILGRQGIDLNFNVHGNDAANLVKFGLPPPHTRDPFTVSGRILDFGVKQYSFRDLKIYLGENKIGGRVDLNLAAQPPHLETTLASEQFDLGPFKLTARLTGLKDRLALDKLDLKIGSEALAVLTLRGSVKDVLDRKGVDIQFGIKGKNLANLEKLTGQSLPVRGAFTVSGRVKIPKQKTFQIPKLEIILGANRIKGSAELNLSGQHPQIDTVLSSPKFNLQSILKPDMAELDWVKALADLKSFKLAVKLSGFMQELNLENLDLQAGNKKRVAVALKGSVRNLTAQRGINLNFKVQGENAANLEKYINQRLPVKGPFAVSGQMTDPAAKTYKIDDMKIAMGTNRFDGGLNLNLAGKQPELVAELSTPKLTLQSVSIPALGPLTRIEDLGPLRLAVNITGSGKKMSLADLDLNFGSEKLIEIVLKGAIKDLTAFRGIKLEFNIRGDHMANLKKIGGPSLPFQGAFNVSGRYTDPAPKSFKISSLKAVLGDNEGKGWVAWDLSKKPLRLSAELSSEKFDLRPFLAKTKTPAPGNKINKDKVFSDERLDLKGLKAVDADIKLRSKEILLQNLALNDVAVDILLENGNFKIKPAKFTIGGGMAEGRLHLRSQDTPAILAVGVKVDQLEIGPMLDQLDYKRNVAGNLDADIELHGAGDSVAALMAGLNGRIYTAINDGRVASEYLELLQRYLGSNFLQLINPFQAKQKYERINCFINRIEIKDGRAECYLLLDTRQTSIFGTGKIDLKTEKLNLGLKPVPKKGHGVSGLGKVSFSLGKLSQPFALGGTLAHPSLVIDPRRTVFTFGKLTGALALGPAGLTAFFADVSVGKQDPCEVFVQSIKKEYQTTDGKKGDESSKKSGGFFKRLFRK